MELSLNLWSELLGIRGLFSAGSVGFSDVNMELHDPRSTPQGKGLPNNDTNIETTVGES